MNNALLLLFEWCLRYMEKDYFKLVFNDFLNSCINRCSCPQANDWPVSSLEWWKRMRKKPKTWKKLTRNSECDDIVCWWWRMQINIDSISRKIAHAFEHRKEWMKSKVVLKHCNIKYKMIAAQLRQYMQRLRSMICHHNCGWQEPKWKAKRDMKRICLQNWLLTLLS